MSYEQDRYNRLQLELAAARARIRELEQRLFDLTGVPS